jgi:Rrf2 family transcriptional regulator, nitric oxide-sensitive transcriptional repressor
MSRSSFGYEVLVISQTVEYAFRAVVHLAYQADTLQTTEQIAEGTLVPKPYLTKVLQQLNHAGLVQLRRGIGGGVTLAKPTHKITVLDVVNAVEPMQRIRTCPLGLKAHGVRLCPLHKRIDNALSLMEDAFRQTTLAEILAEPSKSQPLCEGPTGRRISLTR